MAKSKLTQKDTLGESNLSYSIFLDLYDNVTCFIENLEFFIDATFQGKKKREMAINFICDHVEAAKKELRGIYEKSFVKGDTEKPKGKETSTFDDHRFWEYVAQIKIDKHNPADILESWLRKNTDYFDDEVDEFYKVFFNAVKIMTDEQKQELETFLNKIVSEKAV